MCRDYIENQFFITKSSTVPLTIWKRIGEALANRAIKAAKAGARYKVFVVMPSIMTLPGELSDPRAFPACLAMEHNYQSINQEMIFQFFTAPSSELAAIVRSFFFC